MKILLFGKDGQIGRSLKKELNVKNTIIPIGHNDCDFEKSSDIYNTLNSYDFDLVINAAAFTNVKMLSKTQIEPLINSIAPKIISELHTKKHSNYSLFNRLCFRWV